MDNTEVESILRPDISLFQIHIIIIIIIIIILLYCLNLSDL
jgi:hypothetical protein